MRAGSLSDPRVVALLGKHFVAVHMTELCTRSLIEDPRDVALLERYDKECEGMGPLGGPGFFGGEREAFFTTGGELVDVFLSLHEGEKQFSRAGRGNEAAVARFFDAAAKAWRGALPEDWAALRDGTAPEVLAVKGLAPPEPPLLPGALRVMMRHDWMMYEDLAGTETVVIDTRGLVPEERTTCEWPEATFRALARRLYPRGGGVLIDLDDGSVTGGLVTTVTSRGKGEVRGTFQGRFALEPSTDRERGMREHYRPFVSCKGELKGDFVWKRGAFASFRLAGFGVRAKSTWTEHGDRGEHDVRLGIELAR